MPKKIEVPEQFIKGAKDIEDFKIGVDNRNVSVEYKLKGRKKTKRFKNDYKGWKDGVKKLLNIGTYNDMSFMMWVEKKFKKADMKLASLYRPSKIARIAKKIIENL